MDQSQMIRLQNYNHLLLYRHQKFPIKIGMENYMIHMPLTRLIISLGESLADWQPVEWRQTHNDRLPLGRWVPDGQSFDW